VKVRPDRRTFDELASSWALVPMWTELLADVSTPVGVFPALAGEGPGILLESVERSERWGRYSFAAGDPAAVITADRQGVALRDLRRDGLPIAEPAPG
jgi:anthranilate synthase component 1